MPVPGLSLLGLERIRGFLSILRYINPIIIIIIIINIYYDIRSPVAYSGYSKLYPYIKIEEKYHVTPKYLHEVVKQTRNLHNF